MKSSQQFINEAKNDGKGYNIVIDMDNCSDKDLKSIEVLADKYGIENDGDGNFYVYDTSKYHEFITHLKKEKIGKVIYTYIGYEPDYNWEAFEILKF